MVKIECQIEDYKDGYVTMKYRRSPDVEAGLKWLTGCPLVCTFEKEQDKRTLAQNDLMHWYYRIISNHDQTNFNTVKESMKIRFGMLMNVDGELVPKPTHDYTNKEAQEYIDRLHHHCVVDLGMDVNPGTELFEAYQETRRKKRETVS